MSDLSVLEERILNEIQTGFPLSPDPYADIGRAVGCSREEAHRTVSAMRQKRVIRRVGGVFVAGRLGYVSCLVAARVHPSRLEEAAAEVAVHPEVTHDYEREGTCNLWFTIVAEGEARMEEILRGVRDLDGVESVQALPALRTFKIRVDLRFGEDGRDGA